jgi:hypothetical protein
MDPSVQSALRGLVESEEEENKSATESQRHED